MAAKKVAVKRKKADSENPALARGVSGDTDPGRKPGDDVGAETAVAVAPAPKKRVRKPKAPATGGGKGALVIVESPTKAKTIGKYLGSGYTVKATVGHLRDLPQRKLGVDVENGFTPEYVTIKEKAKTLAEIKKAAKASERVLLATDPDREGEAIAWHVASQLGNGKSGKIRRVLFHEITRMRWPTRWPIRSTSTSGKSTPNRRAACSTGWSATRRRRSSGRASRPACPRAGCRRWRCG